MLSKKQLNQLFNDQKETLINSTFEERYKYHETPEKKEKNKKVPRFCPVVIVAMIVLLAVVIMIPFGIMMNRKTNHVDMGKTEENKTSTETNKMNENHYQSEVLSLDSEGFLDLWWNSLRETAPKERVFTFEDRTFNLKYVATDLDPETQKVYDIYRDDESNVQISFWNQSDELHRYSCYKRPANYESIPRISEESLSQKVDRIVEKYISLDEYEKSISKQSYEEFEVFDYSYKKKIGEFETSDRIEVTIDDRGIIRSLNIGYLNCFSETSSISLSREQFEKSLADLYVRYGWDEESYRVLDNTLTKTRDNQYAIVSAVDHVYVSAEDGVEHYQLKYVLTVID